MKRQMKRKNRNDKTVGAFDAKTRFGELLQQVEQNGVSFTITRRGVPVAQLGPVEERATKAPEEILRAFCAFQEAHPLKGLTTKELIDEGRQR